MEMRGDECTRFAKMIKFAFRIGAIFIVVLQVVCANHPDEKARLLQTAEANADPSAQNLRRIAQQDWISSSRQNAITIAIARVSPAVVSINTRKIEEYYQQNPLAFDPFWQHFFPRYNRVMQEVHGLGSGFIFSKAGDEWELAVYRNRRIYSARVKFQGKQ